MLGASQRGRYSTQKFHFCGYRDVVFSFCCFACFFTFFLPFLSIGEGNGNVRSVEEYNSK